MNLLEAHRRGLPLVLVHPVGGERLIAELFPLQNAPGVVLADVGWPTATLNPFHRLTGAVRETEEGWQVGDISIRIAFEGEQLYADWMEWLAVISR